ESAATLHEVLEFEKCIDQAIENLRAYASLKCAEDASDAESLARESQLQSLLTLVGEACSFLGPEIQAIDDDTFARFLADPVLGEWTIPLKKLRRLKAHTLSQAEERL